MSEFNSRDPENQEEFVFVIVMISFDKITDSMSIEPVGIYRTLKKALKYSNELEDATDKNKHIEVAYDVLEFKLDEEPFMLDFLKKRKERLDKKTDEAIIDLMKRGIVDQLVGEDGNFYYTLTHRGREKIADMNLPKYISNLFKKKNE